MRRPWYASLALASVVLAVWQVSSVGQALDKEVKEVSDRLLMTYSSYKGYEKKHGFKSPAEVYAKLGADRQGVFDAVVRALFVPLKDKDKKLTGKRPIDYVTEVRGVWGWRKGVTQGRYVFRASVRVDKDLSAVLKGSSNLPKKSGGHVLRPMPDGGDDDPTFTDFESIFVGDGIVTFREPNRIGLFGPTVPSTQVSILDEEPEVAEVDIDYDRDLVCHNQPSNSDTGSRNSQSVKDTHLQMLNAELKVFAVPMTTSWSKPEFHCKESYQ